MIQLTLTEEEAGTLKDILENYLSDLRQEISATDLVQFKDTLKERKTVILKVLEALPETNQ